MGSKKGKYEVVVIPSGTDVSVLEEETEGVEAKAENSPREEFKSAVKEAIEETKNENGTTRHKDCYLAVLGDEIVLAFIPDPKYFKAKELGKIFQILGEAGLKIESATTLSASELFDRQVRPKELFD